MDTDRSLWNLLEGEYSGHPLLVRFRQFRDDYPRATLSVRLNIIWTMRNPNENGLATDREADDLGTFEDRLVLEVEQDEQSVLAVVLTCDGKREFVFYTANAEQFIGRINEMPQELERYPIDISCNTDPDWQYFAAVTAPA